MWKLKHRFLFLVVPVFLGIVLLFFPLLGDFHIESAMLVSLVGCFWAGVSACRKPENGSDFFSALQLAGLLFLVGLPLLINAILTGCFSIDGLAFWLLFPLPSVFFGYATGRLLRIWDISYRRLITVAVLIAVALGIFLYELFTYPQVYFFNHVWGGWPGPIYDEIVRMNEATVFFRLLTILWSILLWYFPSVNSGRLAKWIVGFAAVSLLIGYTQLAEFGVISPRSYLQHVLGGHKSAEHFELYYDRQLYSDYEVDLLAKEHKFYFDQIAGQLELSERDTSQKIESYLYGHAWQKKELVGAKFTSFVPVWLEQDQLHIAKQQIDHSLKHELVHVLTKEFGNKLFNASWSIGLVEGIAVAIDGGSSLTSTVDQIVVSEKPYPTAEELKYAFSPRGFYGGRSGVNYTTSGSFVRFLMKEYPIKNLKEAYRTGDFTGAYETDWKTLAEKWHQFLDTVEADTVDQQVARRIFSRLSLFEKECPHLVSDFGLAQDRYRFFLANRDTTQALDALDRALALSDSLPPIKAEWSYRNLKAGNPKKVQQTVLLRDSTVDLQLLYADAFAMTDNMERARPHLQRAEVLFEENPDSLLKPALATRQNDRQWSIYRQMTYHDNLPDSTIFSAAHPRTKIRSINKAIDHEKWQLVESYTQQLIDDSLRLNYFDDYLQLIHHLAFQGKEAFAKQLIGKLSDMPLRERYHERLQQQREWLTFQRIYFEGSSSTNRQ